MATIVREGIKLAYEDRGAGKPAFVFIHAAESATSPVEGLANRYSRLDCWVWPFQSARGARPGKRDD